MSIAKALERLRQGGSFEDFERATRRDWERIAQYLYRRWPLPAGVEADDLRQELLLASWQAASKWEPEHNVSLKRFVVWQSVTAAKHWLNKQRAAGKFGDLAPSRHPIAFAELEGDYAHYPKQLHVMVESPRQHEVAAMRQMATRVHDIGGEDERAGLLALLDTGSVAGAVDRLFTTRGYRRKRDAREVVNRTIAALEVS